MAQIEDQRILIWCNQENNIQAVILDAVYLALKLEKGICLFANYSSPKNKKIFYKRIVNYAKTIKKDIPDLDVSTLLLKGKLSTLMNDLGVKYNSILLCCGSKVDNTLLKAFYLSGFPFLFSKPTQHSNYRFKKIIIPIDYRNSTKESTLWGSYLGRFNQSEIVLNIANDTNKDLQFRVATIVAFVKKFYSQFMFNYLFENGQKGSWGIHKETILKEEKFDLLIFTGSLNVSLIDKIIGPFEKRIINKTSMSVLLNNPQKEMFVLCN